MYEAVNERTDERVTGFWCREELEAHLKAVSVPGDFWDVSSGHGIDYYYDPFPPTYAE